MRAAPHAAAAAALGGAMKLLISLGRPLFAIAMLAFAALSFVYADPLLGLAPLPAALPLQGAWAWLFGLLLSAAGAAILLGWQARPAAISLGLLLLAWVTLLHLPLLAQHPRSGNEWTCLFETLALCGAAWVLAGTLGSELPVRRPLDRRLDQAARAGRYAFAAALPVFGALHFIYIGYVVSVLPAWLPWPQFWGYFTGLAHAAAGLGILAGVQARLAATLTGAMYGSWVLVLHLPRVLAHLDARAEWTSLFVALALCGAAWMVADSFHEQDT
jgi:uncharacterized membrane protein